MKPTLTLLALSAVLTILSPTLPCPAAEEAPVNLLGVWKWNFTMPDGGEITPRLRFKWDEKQKALTGTTRFRTGGDVPLSNIVVEGRQISFEVVRERNGQPLVTRYSGTRNGDTIKGKITSRWNGQEQSYDWEAKHLNDIDGAWKWRPAPPRRGGGGDSTNNPAGARGFGEFTMTLKRDGDKVTGKISLGRFGDMDIHHGRFRKEELSFHTVREREDDKVTNYYRGKLVGDFIKGKYDSTSGGETRTNEWNAYRAD